MLSTAAMELTESPCIFQFLIPCFALNPRICPLNSFTEFLNRTCSLGNNEKRLFIRYVKPHNVVSRDTISRATKFSTRSTRTASASKVKGKDVPSRYSFDSWLAVSWNLLEVLWQTNLGGQPHNCLCYPVNLVSYNTIQYGTLFIVVHTLNYMD